MTMQKIVAFSGLLSVGLFLSAGPVLATNTVISTNTSKSSTTTLNSGDTFTVNPTITYNETGSGTVGVTIAGSSTITNNGTIENTATASKSRAIRITGTGTTDTINNGSATNSAALITATGSDAFQANVPGNVTINNYGTVSTTHAAEGSNGNGTSNQALNLNVINSDGTVTSTTSVINNFSTGTVSAFEADALRPGAGTTVNNSGTIISSFGTDTGNTSSSDGIDAQDNNTGITINNGATSTQMSGVTSPNLIEGERHGITGGQQTDTIDTAGSSGGNANGIFDQAFTMTINNAANSTIKGDNGSGVNIDGVDNTEKVTISNAGTIVGTGVTRDGDGVDVDGIVNLNNTGTITSNNADADGSEGVTVGGGTIINSGTIEGKNTLGDSAYARGITLAGIDHTTTNGTDTDIPIEKTYANSFGANGSTGTVNANGTSSVNTTGTSYITNNSGGLIKGDSDSGIAILGVNTNTGAALYGGYTAQNYAVVITNNAGATIEGAGSVAVIDGSADVLTSSDSGGTAAVGIASANNETVIDSGTIKVDGTGAAISLGSGTNSVQILGGAASINGDISGGTSAGSNTLLIDPNSVTTGQSFSYSHVLSNFSSVTLNSGTITLSGASTYTGSTTVAGGTSYINNTSGSGTGTGAVGVSNGATLGGTGIIKPGSGNGVTLAANSTLVSGGVQSGTTAGPGLTLDNTTAQTTILDASIGSADLTFNLGAGTNFETNTSHLSVLGDTTNELKFAAGDTITLNDLTNGGLALPTNAYLLIQAGSDADYSGITTTGDIDGLTNQNGYVTTSFNLAGNTIGDYSNVQLYLSNGDLEVLEVTPEPSSWALGALCLGVFAFWRMRRVQA
jgi:hypothetical protein